MMRCALDIPQAGKESNFHVFCTAFRALHCTCTAMRCCCYCSCSCRGACTELVLPATGFVCCPCGSKAAGACIKTEPSQADSHASGPTGSQPPCNTDSYEDRDRTCCQPAKVCSQSCLPQWIKLENQNFSGFLVLSTGGISFANKVRLVALAATAESPQARRLSAVCTPRLVAMYRQCKCSSSASI